jgi:hypothetical protein
MEQLWALIHYLPDHPRAALGVVVALGGIYWLMNRKPKLMREADKRLEEIRKERGDPYNKLRPLE